MKVERGAPRSRRALATLTRLWSTPVPEGFVTWKRFLSAIRFASEGMVSDWLLVAGWWLKWKGDHALSSMP